MKTWIIRSAVFFLLLGMSAVAAFFLWGMSHKIPDGVTVSGWEVGGLTAAEFKELFGQKVHALEQTKVTLRASPEGIGTIERTATLRELGLQLNAGKVRAEIAGISAGNVWERAVRRFEWRDRDITLRAGINKRTLEASMKMLFPEIYASEPVNATRVITPYDTVKYIPGRSAARIETDTLQLELARALEGGSGSVLVPGGATAESFPAPRLFDASVGILARSALGVIDVPLYQLQPEVNVSTLRAEGIERLIVKFSTSFASSAEGRKHNVRSAAAVINDMVLPPGGVFDYGKVIEETRQRFGFREAPVIFNGKLVPGIGGGICQVSTTVYNAILRAGLEIVERRNHSLPIGYAPMGQDATFASGYINFKWRNSTGKHLLIRTEADGGVLTVKLFGTMPNNVTYEIKSVTVKTIEPPKKYVKNSSLPEGTVSLLQAGKPGYIVETYRYKKVDGKVVDQEKISRDTYKPTPALYMSNAGDAPGPGTPGSNPGSDSGTPGSNPGSSGSGTDTPRGGVVEDGVLGPVFD